MASQPGSRYQDKRSHRWFLADPADRTSNSVQEIASKQGKPNRDCLRKRPVHSLFPDAAILSPEKFP